MVTFSNIEIKGTRSEQKHKCAGVKPEAQVSKNNTGHTTVYKSACRRSGTLKRD